MKLFVSPHNDDAALFGAFTIQRERAVVLTVFDSCIQVNRGHKECGIHARRAEDLRAMAELGAAIEFGGVRDDESKWDIRSRVFTALAHWTPEEVWLPAIESGGHEQHNLVGEVGLDVFQKARIHRYLTYTALGKSIHGVEVPASGGMVLRKLRALVCYKTQLENDALGCWPHFMRDQREFLLAE